MLKTIGTRVKKLRLQRGIRSDTFALSIKVVPSTLWKMECGFFEFKYSDIIKIAEALQLSVPSILCGENETIASYKEIKKLKCQIDKCQIKIDKLKKRVSNDFNNRNIKK